LTSVQQEEITLQQHVIEVACSSHHPLHSQFLYSKTENKDPHCQILKDQHTLATVRVSTEGN